MKKVFKSKFGTILILIATVTLAGIAIFTAFRLYKLRQESVAPNAPTSQPGATCVPQCPRSDGVLDNCEPDGESICNATFAGKRIEECGGKSYCCNNNQIWTTNLTDCGSSSTSTPTPTSTPITLSCNPLAFAITSSTSTPTSTPTPTPNPSGTPNSCNGTCGSDTNCQEGLYCYNGYCRNSSCPTDTDCVCTTTESQAELPEAGNSTPTFVGLGLGISLLLISLFLAL